MSFSKIIIELAAKAKPILVKIIPAKYLSAAKAKLIEANTAKLKNVEIYPYDFYKNRPGVNLIGNIRGDNGIGQSTRLVADILEESNRDFLIYNYFVPPGGSMTNHSYDYKLLNDFRYNTNIIHINASEFTVAFLQLGKDTWDYRYNIAFWLWELEDFPQEWVGCIDLIDEIWTPAEFVSKSLRKVTNKPVNTIPYHVTAPVDDIYDRKYFNLPEDKFLFLMMFDSGSIMERKNPIGTIEAFKKAFDKDNHNVGIAIKINAPEEKDLELLNSILEGYNIYFITDTLSKIEVNSLVKSVDVYVSLHRAEGFGLVLAEAMLLNTPTIATNWSANTEFMNSDVACMIDYDLVEIQYDMPPFKKGFRWADPDLKQASEYMKKLYEDKLFYNNISINAKAYVEDKLSMKRSVDLMEKRLNEIENGLKKG